MSEPSVRQSKTIKSNFIKTTSHILEEKKNLFILECDAIEDNTCRKVAHGFAGLTLKRAKEFEKEAIEDNDKFMLATLQPILNFYKFYSVKTAKKKKKRKVIDTYLSDLNVMIDVEILMSSIIESVVENSYNCEFIMITEFRIRKGVKDDNCINDDQINNKLKDNSYIKDDISYEPHDSITDIGARYDKNQYTYWIFKEYYGYDIDYANVKMMLGLIENLEPNLETISQIPVEFN